jgi:GNAT superfamily N-acetyltransferase
VTAAPTFFVRIATPADAAAVGAVLAASYPTLLAPHYEKDLLALVLPLITRANPRLLESGTFYVAQCGKDELVGCGGWTKEHPGTGEVVPGQAHIRHFATHPFWTRKGVARAIMERCFEDAAARGIVELQCFSTLAAENFYLASGFEAMARAHVLMGSNLPFPTIVMQRELP